MVSGGDDVPRTAAAPKHKCGYVLEHVPKSVREKFAVTGIYVER